MWTRRSCAAHCWRPSCPGGGRTARALPGRPPASGRDHGYGDRLLWTLVAHHTCANVEAEERGLGDVLAAEFPVDDAPWVAVAALTYCDMNTGPDGRPLDVDQRLAEIFVRYPPDHLVHRAITRAEPLLRAQVAETEQRLVAS